MKFFRVLLFSLLLFSFSLCEGQSWDWGRGGISPHNYNTVYASPGVATDKNGNAYITGSYTSASIIFGNDTLSYNGTVYLTKYNQVGSVIWAKHLVNNTGLTLGNSIATDKKGNIYISGSFYGTIYADTFSLTNNNPNQYASIYLIKYNTSGAVLWAKQGIISANMASNSVGNEVWNSVATDKSGNVFITGYFADTISFGSFTLTGPMGDVSTFLVKYDSNGNELWAKQSKESGQGGGESYAVTTDNIGNSYIAGYFTDSASFGATKLRGNNTNQYGFLVKYSPTGNVLWARQSENNVNPRIYGSTQTDAIVTDMGNNVYITGAFSDSVEFSSHILYSPPGESTVFLTKYDSNGNVIWDKKSSVKWTATGLASDAKNHIYMSGFADNGGSIHFDDTLKFGSYELYKNPRFIPASFLMEFDTSGNALRGSILNDLEVYGSGGAACDSTGTYIYMTSCYNDTVVCGPDTLFYQGTNSGYNPFIGRWLGNGVSGINTILSHTSSLSLFPNPNNGQFTIQLSEAKSGALVEIYNMLGEKVFTETLRSTEGDNTINLSAQPNGIYLYRVLQQDGSLMGEGKVVIEK